MLTQAQLAANTGLGITQLRKYLARALIDVIENRKKLIADEDVIIQEVNSKVLKRSLTALYRYSIDNIYTLVYTVSIHFAYTSILYR